DCETYCAPIGGQKQFLKSPNPNPNPKLDVNACCSVYQYLCGGPLEGIASSLRLLLISLAGPNARTVSR
ncbi:unnamed protein product, partial [Amoebophrya sp. A25]